MYVKLDILPVPCSGGAIHVEEISSDESHFKSIFPLNTVKVNKYKNVNILNSKVALLIHIQKAISDLSYFSIQLVVFSLVKHHGNIMEIEMKILTSILFFASC